MTQHKVLSDDSMTAMDEIARVLGQDAVILSTKKIGQKIEIIGSNDIKDILKSSKKNQKKPDFKELFSKAPLSKNISNNSINTVIKNKNNEKLIGEENFVSKKDLEVFKCEIKSILNESIITDLNSLNNHIDDNNFIKLLNEGYSKKTINSVFENLNKKETSRSINNFYNVLSKKLTFDLKDKLLNSNTILVSGLSGVGKTTICAKIASYLLDQSTSSYNNDNVKLVNFGKTSPNKTSNLFNFGRVLNLNVYSFSEIENLDKYISENKNETIIIDISKDFLVDKNFNDYLKIIHSDDRKILLNVIQSGINFKSLEKQMSYLDGLSPINVLTKLDEIIINSYDFSMYHDLNCKLGLLSGTNNIIDSIAFANSLILAQYMKEN
tara:strand:- start:2365 stop:3507 length:1143 start_codon:yes stop_codon:yes gene_type:complete